MDELWYSRVYYGYYGGIIVQNGAAVPSVCRYRLQHAVAVLPLAEYYA